MKIETVELDNKDYYVVEKVNNNNNLYYILINTVDNKDMLVRKVIEENGEKYLVGLDSELEFDEVMLLYQKKGGKRD